MNQVVHMLLLQKTFIDLIPYLSCMCVRFGGASYLIGLQIRRRRIKYCDRYDGSAVVYKLSKMPALILRHIVGLVKLRFQINFE